MKKTIYAPVNSHTYTHTHSQSVAISTPKHNLLHEVESFVSIWFKFWCWVQNLCKFFYFWVLLAHTHRVTIHSLHRHHTFMLKLTVYLSQILQFASKNDKLKSTLYIFFSHLISFLSQSNIYLLTQNIGKMGSCQAIWQLFVILPKYPYTKFNQKKSNNIKHTHIHRDTVQRHNYRDKYKTENVEKEKTRRRRTNLHTFLFSSSSFRW